MVLAYGGARHLFIIRQPLDPQTCTKTVASKGSMGVKTGQCRDGISVFTMFPPAGAPDSSTTPAAAANKEVAKAGNIIDDDDIIDVVAEKSTRLRVSLSLPPSL